MNFSNPYFQTTFFEVIITFLKRIITLQITLASDELQIIALAALAISCALTGTFLVLRKMTMLANALSHTILVGIVAALFIFSHLSIYALLIASLIAALLTSFFTQFLSRKLEIQEDASIGIVFTTLFALGIVLVNTYFRNAHIGSEAIFGNVDALSPEDLYLIATILLFNIVTTFLFYKEQLTLAFDPTFSQTEGNSTLFYDALLMAQTAITTIAAFKAVGVIMVLALLTAPVLTARILFHQVHKILVVGATIGAFISLIGVAISRHILTTTGTPVSTGSLVVVLLFIFYVLVRILKSMRWKSNMV